MYVEAGARCPGPKQNIPVEQETNLAASLSPSPWQPSPPLNPPNTLPALSLFLSLSAFSTAHRRLLCSRLPTSHHLSHFPAPPSALRFHIQIQEVKKQEQWCAVEAAGEDRARWATCLGPMPGLRRRQPGLRPPSRSRLQLSRERPGLLGTTHRRRRRPQQPLLRRWRRRRQLPRWTWAGTTTTTTALMDRTPATSLLTGLRPRSMLPQVEGRLWATSSAAIRCDLCT